MTGKFISGISLLFSLIAFTCNLDAQTADFKKIRWEHEKIAPGLIWKSSHTYINDSIPQNINVLIVNLNKRKISIDYNPKENIAVSRQCAGSDALAAVNAGFFDMMKGGSVTYIRTGGLIADSDTSGKWKRRENMNGAILILHDGSVNITKCAENSWYDSHPEFRDILITGPLLIQESHEAELPSNAFITNRHPRTAIGAGKRHRIILVTVDGRTKQSLGMSLTELTDLMAYFHCKEAVNLDGGGSTTMWIKNMPFNGIVNMPCDNRKFDHEGERAVSDIIVVK
ncbi:MAG TPA: phosphodiester glycosidase family protein [Bacteroidales bacterium]|nr:phosphodiester glycosidase family protein [Bacteroidales bacterium]